MPHVLDLDRGDVVEQLHRPVQRVAVEPVLERGRRPAREDRRAYEPVRPRDRLAARVQPRRDPVVVVRAIHIVLDVFLAGPDHLHGPVDLLGDTDGLGDVVDFETPAETAAQEVVVHYDLLQRQARDFGGRRPNAAQYLRAGPHLAAVRPDVHRAVHRLHGHVREERGFVHRLDPLRRTRDRPGGIPLLPRDDARRLRGRREPLDDVGGAERGIRPVVPADGERRQSLFRRPHVVGHHGNRLVEPDDLAHALDGLRLAVIEASYLASEDRTRGDRGDLHPWQPHVDAKLRRAVYFCRSIEPLGGRADELEVFRVLERDLRGQRQLCGLVG